MFYMFCFVLSRSSRNLTSFVDWLIDFWLRECRECKGEAHEPCDCETWKMWLRKVAEMKPEERKYWFSFFIPHMDGDLKYLLMQINQTKCLCSGRVSFSLCSLPALPALWPVAGVSEAYEDAANCLWLLSNAKPCANCKSPIQKNEGCNHMQCAKVISLLNHSWGIVLFCAGLFSCL